MDYDLRGNQEFSVAAVVEPVAAGRSSSGFAGPSELEKNKLRDLRERVYAEREMRAYDVPMSSAYSDIAWGNLADPESFVWCIDEDNAETDPLFLWRFRNYVGGGWIEDGLAGRISEEVFSAALEAGPARMLESFERKVVLSLQELTDNPVDVVVWDILDGSISEMDGFRVVLILIAREQARYSRLRRRKRVWLRKRKGVLPVILTADEFRVENRTSAPSFAPYIRPTASSTFKLRSSALLKSASRLDHERKVREAKAEIKRKFWQERATILAEANFAREQKLERDRLAREKRAAERVAKREAKTELRASRRAPPRYDMSYPVKEVSRKRKAVEPADVEVQCGKFVPPPLTHAERRAKRDEAQQRAAVERDRRVWRSQPKKERERFVAERRRERLLEKNCVIETQGGLANVAVAASAALVGGSFVHMAHKIRRVLGKTEQLLDLFRQFASDLKKRLGKVVWAVPLLALCMWAVHRWQIYKTPVLMAPLLGALAAVLAKPVWNFASKFFREGSKVQLQTGIGGIHDAVSKVFASVMVFSIFRNKIPSHIKITEFLRRLSFLPKITESCEILMKWLEGALQATVDFFTHVTGKERIELFNKIKTPFEEWVACVERSWRDHSTASVEADPKELDKLVDLVVEGSGYKEAFRGTRMQKIVDEYVVRASMLLQPHLGALNARNNYRMEPVMLCLTGTPGIGKTKMAIPLCAAIMKLSGLLPASATEEDVIREVWQKGTTEYWNGYSRQKCLVMDDLFQQRVTVGAEDNEYLNIIRMVGSWSFPLNFADLASKGKIYFASPFIFATTNTVSIRNEAAMVVSDVGAVSRRIRFPYKIRVKENYQVDGMLDHVAFQREQDSRKGETNVLDRFPWHIWEAAEHDFLSGATNNHWRPLKEVILTVASELRSRIESHSTELDMLKNMIRGDYCVPAPSTPNPAPVSSEIEPLASDEALELAKAVRDMAANRASLTAPIAVGADSALEIVELQSGFNYQDFSRVWPLLRPHWKKKFGSGYPTPQECCAIAVAYSISGAFSDLQIKRILEVIEFSRKCAKLPRWAPNTTYPDVPGEDVAMDLWHRMLAAVDAKDWTRLTPTQAMELYTAEIQRDAQWLNNCSYEELRKGFQRRMLAGVTMDDFTTDLALDFDKKRAYLDELSRRSQLAFDKARIRGFTGIMGPDQEDDEAAFCVSEFFAHYGFLVTSIGCAAHFFKQGMGFLGRTTLASAGLFFTLWEGQSSSLMLLVRWSLPID